MRNSNNWRREKNSTQRGYGYKWQSYRKGFLLENPLCVMCQAKEIVKEATVVDHIKKHEGDQELFWNPDNHQAVCKHCHDSVKQRLEKSGSVIGCDKNGVPIDANHHWNK